MFTVTDPGFLRWGHQPLSLGQKPVIWQDFWRKLHMEMKEIGPRGGASLAPPWIHQWFK